MVKKTNRLFCIFVLLQPSLAFQRATSQYIVYKAKSIVRLEQLTSQPFLSVAPGLSFLVPIPTSLFLANDLCRRSVVGVVNGSKGEVINYGSIEGFPMINLIRLYPTGKNYLDMGVLGGISSNVAPLIHEQYLVGGFLLSNVPVELPILNQIRVEVGPMFGLLHYSEPELTEVGTAGRFIERIRSYYNLLKKEWKSMSPFAGAILRVRLNKVFSLEACLFRGWQKSPSEDDARLSFVKTNYIDGAVDFFNVGCRFNLYAFY